MGGNTKLGGKSLVPHILIIGGCDPQTYYALEALSSTSFARINLLLLAPLTSECLINTPSIKTYKLREFPKIKPNYIRAWFIRRKIKRLLRSVARDDRTFVVNFLTLPLLKSTSRCTVLQYLHGPATLDHVYIRSIKRSLLRKALMLLQWPIDKDSIDILRHNIKLANSRFTALYTSKWLRDNHYEILYPPCEVEYFKIHEDLVPSKKDVIITAGRISPEKNYEFIVSLAEKLTAYRFLIAGRTENLRYYASLLRLIKSRGLHNIKVMTNLSKSKLRSLYWASKVYVHAMKGEHFGKTIVEAMAGGCVPLVPSIGGGKEIVNGVGYVFSDISDATSKIDEIMRCWNKDQAYDVIERSKLFGVEAYKKRFVSILEKYDR